MSTFPNAFDALYGRMTDARCEIFAERFHVAKALSSGWTEERLDTEEGIIQLVAADIKIKADDDLLALGTGAKISVQFPGDRVACRIRSRKKTGGIVTLQVEAIHA